jgi:hypothetical protein
MFPESSLSCCEGPNFSPNYATLLLKWWTRLSLTINREIANAIFEGARNARGGERQFAAGCGLAESNLHLFEPVQLLGCDRLYLTLF